jgi:hypothetical protein
VNLAEAVSECLEHKNKSNTVRICITSNTTQYTSIQVSMGSLQQQQEAGYFSLASLVSECRPDEWLTRQEGAVRGGPHGGCRSEKRPNPGEWAVTEKLNKSGKKLKILKLQRLQFTIKKGLSARFVRLPCSMSYSTR